MSIGVQVGFEGLEDFAGDVAFEAADDVFFGKSFGLSAGHAVAGFGIIFESADDDRAEGLAGLTVASAV